VKSKWAAAELFAKGREVRPRFARGRRPPGAIFGKRVTPRTASPELSHAGSAARFRGAVIGPINGEVGFRDVRTGADRRRGVLLAGLDHPDEEDAL